jgi:hypothetical protein
MFKITQGKGFQIEIGNKTVSVQFGPVNYCERHAAKYGSQYDTESWTSKNAEIAVFQKNKWITKDFGFNDDVVGCVSPLDVIQLLVAVVISEGLDIRTAFENLNDYGTKDQTDLESIRQELTYKEDEEL